MAARARSGRTGMAARRGIRFYRCRTGRTAGQFRTALPRCGKPAGYAPQQPAGRRYSLDRTARTDFRQPPDDLRPVPRAKAVHHRGCCLAGFRPALCSHRSADPRLDQTGDSRRTGNDPRCLACLANAAGRSPARHQRAGIRLHRFRAALRNRGRYGDRRSRRAHHPLCQQCPVEPQANRFRKGAPAFRDPRRFWPAVHPGRRNRAGCLPVGRQCAGRARPAWL